MAYTSLGARGPITGALDTSGMNAGNWTVAFTPSVLNINVPTFEVYKIVVTGAAGSTFKVYIDSKLWDLSVFGQQNSWDPTQPMLLNPGQSVYFLYSDPVTDNTPPVVTMWLRFQESIT